ncbi:MAG: hypothetical protein M5U28_49970 [Sandaracinaceae bacterium]|nr:hypothetical protein [Sandaracinaceae bacterium]
MDEALDGRVPLREVQELARRLHVERVHPAAAVDRAAVERPVHDDAHAVLARGPEEGGGAGRASA